ncbi:MAG: hypothetical protein ABW352_06040 [Polyangiales bacterium]
MKWSYLLGLCCLSACTEPQFRNHAEGDAGSCVDAACVASQQEDGSLPLTHSDAAIDARSPADALRGSYAVHARFYGWSTGIVQVLHEVIAIANITREGAGLKMRVETCEDSGQLLTGFRTDVRVKYPEHFPVRTYDLVVEGGSFHTTDEPLLIGYTEKWPSGCSAGARIASSDKWNADGKCDCVQGEPPTRQSDCRVIDSDQDGNPGMTVQASGIVSATQSVRIRDRSQYVLGVIDEVGHRHHASFEKDEDFVELVCSPGDCPKYTGRFCPITQQPASFVPLENANVSCREVLRRVESNLLFSGEGLDGSFPAGC